MHQNDSLKSKVAKRAFEYVINEITQRQEETNTLIWLGIGSGTTIKFFISLLSESYLKGSIPFKFVTVSSSIDSETACRELKLPIRQLADLPADKKFDYYIDGADEVDTHKRCLKGLGGASTREKLLRIESDRFVILIDESKKVPTICTKNPIVLEILPFGFEKTLERIKMLIPVPLKAEIRKGSGKMGYILTDNNNYLVDAYFNNQFTEDFDFKIFEMKLKSVAGVIETGLFADPADVVFIASQSEVEVLS